MMNVVKNKEWEEEKREKVNGGGEKEMEAGWMRLRMRTDTGAKSGYNISACGSRCTRRQPTPRLLC